ncbi:MAG TPA: DNA polymerase III subunit gamma/tau, partial [Ruminococcaceae bacterium]|nr:DNA polymerase III subunit gamma/tau [Oscillospiraceae bacterium]
AEGILSHDTAGAIDIVDALHRDAKDMARLCEELIEHFRSMMLIRTMKKTEGVLVLSEEELRQTTEQAQKL